MQIGFIGVGAMGGDLSLARNLMSGDIKAVARATQLCNLNGMDTTSAGNMAALVMECYETGILESEDLNGKATLWGDGEFIW